MIYKLVGENDEKDFVYNLFTFTHEMMLWTFV